MPIENASTYELIGIHTLTVHGVNGYTASYSITIRDGLLDYIKEHNMYNDFTIDISKYNEVYFEDKLMDEDITFTEIGYYSITVIYSDAAEETIDFTYAHSTNRFVTGGVYPNSLLIQKDSAVSWYIDNLRQNQGIDSLFLTRVGKHTIVFTGHNEYEKRYIVTVTEGDIGIADGDVFEDFFKFKFTGYRVTLNDVNYGSDTKKSGAGNYTLKIKGANQYVNVYNIFINEQVPFEQRSLIDPIQNISESITLDQDFYKIYVNGREEENFRFIETGEYRIVYLGAGGYIDAYTINYINYHEDVNIGLFIGVIGIASLVGVTYLFLAWRKFK